MGSTEETCIDQMTCLLTLLPHDTPQGRACGQHNLGDEGGSRLKTQSLLTQEVSEQVPLGGPTGTQPQIALQEELMLRHRLAPLSIRLNRGLDHRVGHPMPFEPSPQLVVAA